MPQEPLKMFQWNRPLALERLQASQHWLSTLLWETCCEVDRVQLHAEKRDPLRRGEFALFPVDLKPQPAEVPEGEGLLVCSPLRTQSGIEGGSRHGSRRLSGRSLQPNRRDGRIERCVSASTSWTGAWQGPGSEHAGPRLDVTHHVSWVRWSRGLCRALTPSRLEGPAVSRPSPVGPRLLHARQGHPGSTLRWTDCPWTWEDAGQTESRSWVWWSSGASETAWGALARPPGTVQVGPGET